MDDLHQTVGRIEGKVDSLILAVSSYQLDHSSRHAILDQHIDKIQADINMAKGAKGAILVMVATLSAVVSASIASITKWVLK